MHSILPRESFLKRFRVKGISDSATGSATDGQKEAISNEDVPSPPEDDSEDEDTEDNNDMQSDGLTNEEAGLE